MCACGRGSPIRRAQTIAGGLRSLGFDSVSEVRAGKLLRMTFEAERPRPSAEAAVAADVPPAARQPGDGDGRLAS